MTHDELKSIAQDLTITLTSDAILEATFTTKDGLSFRCQSSVDLMGWYAFTLLDSNGLLTKEGGK